MVQFKTVDEKEFVYMLDQAEELFKPERYSRLQFQKYFGGDGVWHVLLEDGIMVAAAVVRHIPKHVKHMTKCMIVAEIQRFKKGYGKILLRYLSARLSNVWLAVDPTGGKKLMAYYKHVLKPLGWEEIVVQKSRFNDGKPQAFWMKAGTKQGRKSLLEYILGFGE